MTEKIISNVMSDVLGETYTYLKSIYSNKDIMILKQMLLNLSGIKKFEFKIKIQTCKQLVNVL